MAVGGLKKILVTGASGMIGSAVLAKLLQTKGCMVKAQVRDRMEARSKLSKMMDLTPGRTGSSGLYPSRRARDASTHQRLRHSNPLRWSGTQ
jgi:nucleoside-diphosphate-sugar epimerase